MSFVHNAQSEGSQDPLPELGAFKEFQREIEDRCEEQPVVTTYTDVGSFG